MSTVGSKASVAFMSYAHHDDSEGRVSRFRERLVSELRSQAGTEIPIFQDAEDIALGERWRTRLDAGLATSTFLLPIVTPSFLMSAHCREELMAFCEHERRNARDDLILPVYWIDCEEIRLSGSGGPEVAAATAVFAHQYADWRELRTIAPGTQRALRKYSELATQIRAAMTRAAPPAADDFEVRRRRILPPPEPGQPAPRTVARALAECCVRIDVGGRHAGSGFFAAPGIVVTCHHVLRLGDLSSDEADTTISVVAPTDARYDVLDARECDADDDLAILRVEPANDHPIVLLDTGFRARDTFTTFCFPLDAPGGAEVALTAHGWVTEDQTLRLAPGVVRRGMSGCPVLNGRTGAVCGVLQRAGAVGAGQAPGAVLEGHVVSVRNLFLLRPTLSSANARHHFTHRDRWFDRLPVKQQRILLSQRTSDPADLPHATLVIRVEQTADQWDVAATVHRRGDVDDWHAEQPLGPIHVDLNSVRALVSRVFRDWASRDAAEQGRVGPGEQIRLLGEILSRALLPDEIGDAFHELVAASHLGWVEVAVQFADDDDADFKEFVQLPWEHLFVPRRARRGDVYFAREPRLAFVRALSPEPRTPEPLAGKLSVLVVAVKPGGHDRPGSKTAAEVDEITNGLAILATQLQTSLSVKVVESPGLHGLADEVAEGDFEVLHYVGFGRFDTGSHDRIALSAGPSARIEYHTAQDIADCLQGAAPPALVVLQVCRGDEPVPADLAGFGPTLVAELGCDAVIAYQYPVPGALTDKFNSALYGALAGGAPLEMAAQLARKKVWSSDSEGRAFLSPALFVRNPGGLRLAPQSRDAGSRARAGALSSNA